MFKRMEIDPIVIMILSCKMALNSKQIHVPYVLITLLESCSMQKITNICCNWLLYVSISCVTLSNKFNSSVISGLSKSQENHSNYPLISGNGLCNILILQFFHILYHNSFQLCNLLATLNIDQSIVLLLTLYPKLSLFLQFPRHSVFHFPCGRCSIDFSIGSCSFHTSIYVVQMQVSIQSMFECGEIFTL